MDNDINLTKKQDSQNLTQPDSLIAGYPIENRHIYLSIDKISLVSFIDFIEKFLPRWDANNLDVCQRIDGGKFYHHSWIMDDYFLQAVPRTSKTHDIRLEFNPNKVVYNPSIVSLLKSQKHSKLTRIDLAVDYIDCEDLSGYFIECLSKSKTPYYLPHTRELSGYIFGENASDTVYRVYNKKLELNKKHGISVDCKSWWRVEIMIRPKNGKEWFEYSPFENLSIGMPSFDGCQLDFEEECVLRMLLDNPNRINELSAYKRRKYKKLITLSEDIIPLFPHPTDALKLGRDWLDLQIDRFLNKTPVPF